MIIKGFFTSILLFLMHLIHAQWTYVGNSTGYFISQTEAMRVMCTSISPSSGMSCTAELTMDLGSTWDPVGGNSGPGAIMMLKGGLWRQGVFFAYSNGMPAGLKQYRAGYGWTFRVPFYGTTLFALDTLNIFQAYSTMYGANGPQTIFQSYINGNVQSPVTIEDEVFRNLFFADAEVGWALSGADDQSKHRLLKTVDSGVSWELILADSTLDLTAMQFVTPEIGFLVGGTGLIMRTDDGGSNWIYQNPGVSVDLYSIEMFDDQLGFVSGAEGHILHTVDGGTSWVMDTIATSSNIGIRRVEDSVLYAFSSSGIFKRDLRSYIPEDTVEIEPEDPEDPSSAYGPNPSTGLLQMSTPTVAQLIEIYDIYGSLKKTLAPMSNKMQLQLYDLSDGPYVIRIRLFSGEILSHKIVLSKPE